MFDYFYLGMAGISLIAFSLAAIRFNRKYDDTEFVVHFVEAGLILICTMAWPIALPMLVLALVINHWSKK